MKWKRVKLTEIVDLQNGYAFSSKDYVKFSNTLNCRMSNIRPGGDFDLHYSPKFLPDDYATKYSDFLLKDDDVVVAMTDLSNNPKILGVPTIVKTDGRNVLLNQRVGKLVFKDNSVVSPKFLRYALNRKEVQSYFSKFANGGLQINLGKRDLLSVEVPLPPLHIQQQIADTLDKADALRRKDQELLKKYDKLAQSIFYDMFGDLFNSQNGSELYELQNVVHDGRIITYGIVQAGPHVEDGVPYIKTGDIKDGNIVGPLSRTSREIAAAYKRSEVNKGDIVMSIRATVGTMALLPDELDGANLTQGTARISPGPLVTRLYLYYFLKSIETQNWIQSQVKGATFREITLGKLRTLPVIVPDIDIQREFDRKIENIKRQRMLSDNNHKHSQLLFENLLYQNFS